MASVRWIGNPVGAGIAFGLLSFFTILTVRIVFRKLNTGADLPPNDLLDMLYFEFDLIFLGLGVLGGAFFGWLRRRSSSALPTSDPDTEEEAIFHTWTFLSVLTTVFVTIVVLLVGSFWQAPYGIAPVGEVLLRVVVFDLTGVLVLFVCSVAALKAPH
jgi:hypothetical protein